MAAIEGARRMGHVANIMLSLSLVTFILSFKLSLALFVGGWLVFALAWVIDGMATPPASVSGKTSVHSSTTLHLN